MSSRVINNGNCVYLFGSMRSSWVLCMMDWKHHIQDCCITRQVSSLVGIMLKIIFTSERNDLYVSQGQIFTSSHQRRMNILIAFTACLNSEYFFSGRAFTSNNKKMQFNSLSWKTVNLKIHLAKNDLVYFHLFPERTILASIAFL